MKTLAALTFLLLASPALAEIGVARPADCLLIVGNEKLIGGRCAFTALDEDGSFQIASPDGRFFAQVLMDRPGNGTGWWNEEPFAGHAHSPLGALRRDDACWVNQRVSVCAW
ncbi:hypothetical protein MASR1M32_10020 [Rhodobacter sp.]